MTVSIKQLKAFVAVVEENSFSLAAERLNATQSGMSMLVQNLELSIGKNLLNRTPGNLKLTNSGQDFYKYSIDILKLMDEAIIETKKERLELEGTIKCGLMPTFTRSVLPTTLSKFNEEHPLVKFKITEAYSGVLEEMVRSKKIEFAIVPSVKNTLGLKVDFVSQDINILVSSKNSNFKHLISVTPSSINSNNLKMILPSAENSRRISINNYFSTHDIKPNSIIEMDGMIGTLEMIASSNWCSILPAVLCDLDIKGKKRTLSPLLSPSLITDYVLIYSASSEMAPATKLFAKQISKKIKQISFNINKRIKIVNKIN